jgi:hypothetical protein
VLVFPWHGLCLLFHFLVISWCLQPQSLAGQTKIYSHSKLVLKQNNVAPNQHPIQCHLWSSPGMVQFLEPYSDDDDGDDDVITCGLQHWLKIRNYASASSSPIATHNYPWGGSNPVLGLFLLFMTVRSWILSYLFLHSSSTEQWSTLSDSTHHLHPTLLILLTTICSLDQLLNPSIVIIAYPVIVSLIWSLVPSHWRSFQRNCKNEAWRATWFLLST